MRIQTPRRFGRQTVDGRFRSQLGLMADRPLRPFDAIGCPSRRNRLGGNRANRRPVAWIIQQGGSLRIGIRRSCRPARRPWAAAARCKERAAANSCSSRCRPWVTNGWNSDHSRETTAGPRPQDARSIHGCHLGIRIVGAVEGVEGYPRAVMDGAGRTRRRCIAGGRRVRSAIVNIRINRRGNPRTIARRIRAARTESASRVILAARCGPRLDRLPRRGLRRCVRSTGRRGGIGRCGIAGRRVTWRSGSGGRRIVRLCRGGRRPAAGRGRVTSHIRRLRERPVVGATVAGAAATGVATGSVV